MEKFFTDVNDRKYAYHVFIAKPGDIGEAKNVESKNNDLWLINNEKRLLIKTWIDVVATAINLPNTPSSENSALSKWAKCIALFLEKSGIHKFSGFEKFYEMHTEINLNTVPEYRYRHNKKFFIDTKRILRSATLATTIKENDVVFFKKDCK